MILAADRAIIAIEATETRRSFIVIMRSARRPLLVSWTLM